MPLGVNSLPDQEVPFDVTPRFFSAMLAWGLESVMVGAFIDSGADDNFIDREFARQLGVPQIPLEKGFTVRSFNRQVQEQVTHSTDLITMTVSGNHVEQIRLKVVDICHPILLGRPWLERHNPHIDWLAHRIIGWSVACHARCLRSAPYRAPRPQPEFHPDLSAVPPEYHDLAEVFNKSRALALPPHRPYDCAIDLVPGSRFPTQRLYNLSPPEKKAMEQYISESLASGLIRPSTSAMAAGFFFVGKKDGGLRPCIDYRQLNDITIKNRYPLPLMSSAFEPLAHAVIFTKLDLRNAYHLVRVRAGDEWKTAFNTPLGHFEYLVMPFGLTNGPAVFQTLINDVLRDMINVFAVVYLDDILIFSSSLEAHRQHVRLVLQRLLENRLFVKAEKCLFHATSIDFLGHVIEAGRIRPDPKKIQDIVDWDPPRNRKELQGFLGFAGFHRRFIKGYSQLTAPLTALTSVLRPFQWTPEAETAFQELKIRFTEAPVLAQPDPERQFILEVDASDSGVGAVLCQRAAADDKIHPCAFFSRRLTPAERNYTVGDRELLAVYAALKEWRHWLEGTELPFLVWSDHRNLTYIRDAKRVSDRQARWAQFFSRFNFTLSFRPGSANGRADALSRLHAGAGTPEKDPDTILPPSRVVGVVTWAMDAAIRHALRSEPRPAHAPPHRQYVPPALRTRVLEWGHSGRLACHPGAGRTLSFLRRRYWWPTMSADVRDFVAACTVCARNKTSSRPASGLLRPLPVPSRPWSHIGMDFVTGLPISRGMSVILTIVDRFSKQAHYVALPKLPSALETADLLAQHVVRLHGIPADVVSDRGPQFVSRVWRAFCRGIGATVSLSSGYHPQTNGQAERANQALEVTLRCVASHAPVTWADRLPWVEYSHNALVSSATGLSPFECALGYQPPLFPQQEAELAVPCVRDHIRRCRRTWKRARETLLRTTERTRRGANRRRVPAPPYQPGQRVWLRARDLPLPVASRKLASRFIGPFEINKVVNPAAVQLVLPPSLKIHPVFHVSQLKPVSTSVLSPVPTPPPSSLTLQDGDPAWRVRKLLDVRRRGRGLQFLVAWEGFPDVEDNTWVPRSYLLDPSLVRDFYRDNPDAIRRSPGVSRRGGDTVTSRSRARSSAQLLTIRKLRFICNQHSHAWRQSRSRATKRPRTRPVSARSSSCYRCEDLPAFPSLSIS